MIISLFSGMRLSKIAFCFLVILLSTGTADHDWKADAPISTAAVDTTEHGDGVDVSFPQHHYLDKSTWQGQRYEKFIKGCRDKFGRRACDSTEIMRINQNFGQPKFEHNYTETGFKKMRVPDHVWALIKEFWETNWKNGAGETLEKWPPGNTYTNNWDSPTYMVSLENKKLRGGDGSVKRKIWNGMRPFLEEWTGERLTETSLYGIRVYKDGAMLSSHVDRLPLVSSCIIHVDSDIDEPWPIEVFDHDGKGHNVTMIPGDAVLYESHTVIHGRPTPLKGRYYANVFVHYAPIDHAKMNERDRDAHANGDSANAIPPDEANAALHDAVKIDTVTRGEKHGHEELDRAFKEHRDAARTKKISGHEQANHESEELARIKEEHGDAIENADHTTDMNDLLRKARGSEATSGSEAATAPAAGALDTDLTIPASNLGVTLDERRERRKADKAQRKREKKARRLEGKTTQEGDPGTDTATRRNKANSSGGSSQGGDMYKLYKYLPVNEAAARGDAKVLQALLISFPEAINRRDLNGWTALHEAARAGETDVVKLLIDNGASLETLTNNGESVLWWARRTLPEGHSTIALLEELEAPESGEL